MRRVGSIFTAVILAAAAVAVSARADERSPNIQGRLALVLIDADALACSPCLASLEALCRAVPQLVQRERMIGVLTYRESGPADPRRARIIRTKWTGYCRAGGIGFPATIDDAHLFDSLNRDGTAVIVFDPTGGGLKRWTPPFSTGMVAEITGYLLGR
ncbi:MAG: hypothetical protein JW843_05500 [Candidatus Aminicenantes bacterium]|nr:hypothetical protein [Candidatus Aminicenantes bacterium]